MGVHDTRLSTDLAQQRLPRMASLGRTRRGPPPRLHAARHTAATVLLVLGVPQRTAMSITGWSSTARYQHVTDPIRREVASRVGGLLFSEGRDHANQADTVGRVSALGDGVLCGNRCTSGTAWSGPTVTPSNRCTSPPRTSSSLWPGRILPRKNDG